MKQSIGKLFCVILILFSSMASYSQTKRALVIGLGQQEDNSWGKINGDKDIPIVTSFLTKAGYGNNIITLVNRQATKKNIVSAFKNLEKICNNGDVVYVHFSGHGQQMKDANGDESDNLDECWIPYDAYKTPCKKDYGDKHLTDDEINTLLKNIRHKVGTTGKILVVVDACHSGDSSRGYDDEDVIRGVSDVFEAVFKKIKRKLLVSSNPHKTESSNSELWITISACKSYQVNAELKKPAVGKLTYAIFQMLNDGKAKDNSSIEKAICRFVYNSSTRSPQTPVISGEINKYNIIDILQ